MPMRWLQGHRKQSSMQLYSREDVVRALNAQEALLQALGKGWMPTTPIARGGQQPLPSRPLDLTPVQYSDIPKHPAFSWNDDTREPELPVIVPLMSPLSKHAPTLLCQNLVAALVPLCNVQSCVSLLWRAMKTWMSARAATLLSLMSTSGLGPLQESVM